MDDRQEVKSLKKALRALIVMNQRGDATVTEVADAIGEPRTTTHRLLATLAREGYLEKQPNSSYYRLTSMVTQLGSGFQRGNLLLEIAKPLVNALGENVGWSVTLATPRATDMVTRITTNHESALALERFAIGMATPILHSTAGYCYLANCSKPEREIILSMARNSGDPLQAPAHHREKLNRILARVRTRGFSNVEFSEYREGNVGVPVLVDGQAVGGLVMRYIKSAMTGDKLIRTYIPELKSCAVAIADAYRARAPHILEGHPPYREQRSGSRPQHV